MPDGKSNELSEALIAGQEKWEQAVSALSGRFEIIGVDFTDIRFTDRFIKGVKFSGCKFDLVNFRKTSLHEVKFTNCTFLRSSLSLVKFEGVSLSKNEFIDSSANQVEFNNGIFELTKLKGGDYKDVVISNSELTQTNFENLAVSSLEIIGNSVSNLGFHGVEADVMTINKCVVDDIDYQNTNIGWLSVLSSRIRGLSILDGNIDNLEVSDCDALSFSISSFDVENIDLSGSIIRKSDLQGFPIEKAILSNTTLRECQLPEQNGKKTWYGNFSASERLLAHPAQEIFGLDADLQSSIYEQQILERFSAASAKNLITKTCFCLWGLLTDYGRSLSRFALFCVLAITVFAGLQVHSCGYIPDTEPSLLQICIDAFTYKAQIFLGFPVATSDLALCKTEHDLYMRLTGFICMGLWIGLAANRLGFLSGLNR